MTVPIWRPSEVLLRTRETAEALVVAWTTHDELRRLYPSQAAPQQEFATSKRPTDLLQGTRVLDAGCGMGRRGAINLLAVQPSMPRAPAAHPTDGIASSGGDRHGGSQSEGGPDAGGRDARRPRQGRLKGREPCCSGGP